MSELIGKDILIGNDVLYTKKGSFLYNVVKVTAQYTFVLKYDCDNYFEKNLGANSYSIRNDLYYKHFTNNKGGELIKIKNSILTKYNKYILVENKNNIYTKELLIESKRDKI